MSLQFFTDWFVSNHCFLFKPFPHPSNSAIPKVEISERHEFNFNIPHPSLVIELINFLLQEYVYIICIQYLSFYMFFCLFVLLLPIISGGRQFPEAWSLVPPKCIFSVSLTPDNSEYFNFKIPPYFFQSQVRALNGLYHTIHLYIYI